MHKAANNWIEKLIESTGICLTENIVSDKFEVNFPGVFKRARRHFPFKLPPVIVEHQTSFFAAQEARMDIQQYRAIDLKYVKRTVACHKKNKIVRSDR